MPSDVLPHASARGRRRHGHFVVPRPHDRHGRVQFRDHFALATAHGEDHGLDRPSFRQDRLERYLDWYARHLAAR